MGEGELMLGAELLPQPLLVGWQDEDELLDLGGELTQRVHQDRLSSEGKELLRQLCPHTSPTPSSHDDGIAVWCH